MAQERGTGMTQDPTIEALKELIRSFVAELDSPTMPYVGEGLQDTAYLTEMSSSDRIAGKAGVLIGSTAYDVSRSTELRWEATALKRSGRYVTAAEKIIESFRLEGHYNLLNLRNLWKVALVGGDAQGALAIIRKTMSTYERFGTAQRHEQLPHPPHEDLADVLEALRTEQSFRSRVQEFSGNPTYSLPRPFAAIKAEAMRDQAPGRSAGVPVQPEKPSGACYVATAVYGNYDAPEVVVLRTFRDERLRPTAVGRAFIRVYYRLSPALARHLPKMPTVSAGIRMFLDSLVTRLVAGPRDPQ
ncbi:CFI-box-CTERM domain-containing protein [Agrococcus sp. TSP3-2-1]|uniref:CFI-box-CTERM domain-containing protein n=1 Tax=Agrococcus sp. TSP3-2-1 TaxID=2804583 RepID=UPI003CF23412